MLGIGRYFVLTILLSLPSFGVTSAGIQGKTTYVVFMRIDEKTVQDHVPEATIEAFDLSPDGKTVALILGSKNPINGSTWIAVVDQSKDFKKIRLGAINPCSQGYAPTITYNSDGATLIVTDCAKVRIFEASSLREVRSIESSTKNFTVPIQALAAANGNTTAITFGNGAPVGNYMDVLPVKVEVVDTSTGKRLASLSADDVPFSLSPDGKQLSLTDRSEPHALLGIKIIEVSDGRRISSTKGKFGFPKNTKPTSPISRLMGYFIGDSEIVLMPDGNRDQQGNTAGDFCEIVSAIDGNEVQTLEPKHFGATGLIATANRGGRFMAISREVSSKDLRHHLALPPSALSEWIAFVTEPSLKVSDRGPLAGLVSLRTRSIYDSSVLRLSADGHVFAVADSYGVTVFAQP